jgi:hypothetical protein
MPNREIQAGRFPDPNLSLRIAYTDHRGMPQIMTVQTTCADPQPIAAAELRLALYNTFERLGWEMDSVQLLLLHGTPVELKAPAKAGFTLIQGSKVA